MAPYRPRSHQIADKSIVRLHDAFVSAGWTVEDLDEDYGEDLLVRLFKGGEATPYTFYVQAKSTDNISRYIRNNDGFIHYPFSAEHLAHWSDFWEPVVLTVWDAQADITYWETIQMAEREPNVKRKRPVVFIPLNNTLDDEGIRRISARTIRRHERFAMEKQGAQLLVDRLQDVLNVEISYDPQLGLLIVTSPDGNTEVTMFGKLAEKVGRLAVRHGVSADDIANKSIIFYHDLFEAFERGSELIVQNKEGLELERWSTFDEFTRHVMRASELDETQ